MKQKAFALYAFRDGTIDVGELSRVLSALGRVAPKDTVVSSAQITNQTQNHTGQVEDLIKRFDVDLSGRIEFGNGEFLGVIASIAVTSVQDIDDFVFSAAFRTFDHVSVYSGRDYIWTDTFK